MHLLTILYAAFGLSEMAYRQPEEAFGLPDLEQVFVREKPSEEERVQNENWREVKDEGRERREVKQGGRGDVEFVHPDLKKELLKQGEDPANPWVWLTSYSRIPVTFQPSLDSSFHCSTFSYGMVWSCVSAFCMLYKWTSFSHFLHLSSPLQS